MAVDVVFYSHVYEIYLVLQRPDRGEARPCAQSRSTGQGERIQYYYVLPIYSCRCCRELSDMGGVLLLTLRGSLFDSDPNSEIT